MDDLLDGVAILALAAYLVGIPISIGVGMAMDAGVAAVLLSPFWPFTGLVWLGYWWVA